jgi:malate synthase
LIDEGGKITPWKVMNEDLASERLYSEGAWDRLFRRPEGPITEKGLRYAVYMASEYMFQQLNGNNAAAIDDYLSGTRLMNDFATYEIFWHWLWTALHRGAALTEGGPSTKKGDRVTPELIKRLLNERTETVKTYFAEQDRKGVKSRFDRNKAALTMEILERQLLHPRWIMYGSRVLDSVKEESEENRKQMLEAVFLDSREAVAKRVNKGEWTSVALEAYDFVYDVFGEKVTG